MSVSSARQAGSNHAWADMTLAKVCLIGVGTTAGLGGIALLWLFFIEPVVVEKRLLRSMATDEHTVAEVLEREKVRLKGSHWACEASDVAAGCYVYGKGPKVLYLWGIDEQGFYPANGRTLRLCRNMSRGVEDEKYGDDDVIPGRAFRSSSRSNATP